mgnify:FL=1
MVLRIIPFLLIMAVDTVALAQNKGGNIVFWSAQEWECEYVKLDLYTLDTFLVYSGKLDQVYQGFEIPDCGEENTLSVPNIDVGNYFFVADCSREQCNLCAGEGSYWQPIVHYEAVKQKGTRNKGNISGAWKTCYLCDGDGQASTTLWIDTLTIYFDKCRSVLLK